MAKTVSLHAPNTITPGMGLEHYVYHEWSDGLLPTAS